jgi:DNA-binding protein Fis
MNNVVAKTVSQASPDRVLTDKQMALVDTLVSTGCTVKQASVQAGYKDSEGGRVAAQKTLKLPHVQAYLLKAVSEHLGTNAARAAARMVTLATEARSEYVQLEASKDILDRTGFKPPDRTKAEVLGDISVKIDLG